MIDTKSCLLVAVLAATAACLPRGNPPVGRQLIADRAATLGTVIPPKADGVLRIIVMRPSANGVGADLSVLELDAAGTASPERFLVAHVDPESSLGCIWKVAPCAIDANGRVFVFPNQGASGGGEWVDPVTGEVTPTDPWDSSYRPQSDSQARSFTLDRSTGIGPTQTGTLYDADGHGTSIEFATPGGRPAFTFVGEDFYYVTGQGELVDVPPSDVPAQVETGVADVRRWKTPDGSLLLLQKGATPGPGVASAWVVRDLLSGVETPLPFDASYAEISPDGGWLLDTEREGSSDTRLVLLDYHLDPPRTVDVPGYLSSSYWRPGTSELWATSYADDDSGPTVWIVTPGAPPVSLPGVALESGHIANVFGGNPFTPDGAYWFSTQWGPMTSTPVIQVGAADDLTGARTDLNPPDTYVDEVWQMQDGRFLVASYTNNVQRKDVAAVDPKTGDRRPLAERGMVAAVGDNRLMGMFRFDEGRGDLMVVALDTGEQTMLAPEFTVTAFAEPQGTDLLAPGTRIVYQFQARTASPYDGIWIANSP